MKLIPIGAACLISITCLGEITKNPFKIVLESKWQDLERCPEKTERFGSKLILVGNIVFKKKSRESVNLTTLTLKWHGNYITNLFGSLYKKEADKEFLPIEENLICDGTWSTQKQTLVLRFGKAETLQATNRYYLVLTVPDHLEKLLDNGTFEIESACLPEQFQSCACNGDLCLSIDIVDTQISYKDKGTRN